MKNKIVEPLRGERLLKTAVNHILAHPGEWDQEVYHSNCGTQHCIAGHCEIIAGEKGLPVSIEDRVALLLGISYGHARWLFDYDRTMVDIYLFAKNFDTIVNVGMWENYISDYRSVTDGQMKPFNLDEIKD